MIFEGVLNKNKFHSIEVLDETDEINMSLSPSINSESSESIIKFHECLNLKK